MATVKHAIITGKIATVYKGRRIVREYKSGQPLIGRLQDDDAPPFTGFVRDWFKQGNTQQGKTP